MAAKENFFKAMKELTGISPAEGIAQDAMGAQPACAPPVQNVLNLHNAQHKEEEEAPQADNSMASFFEQQREVMQMNAEAAPAKEAEAGNPFSRGRTGDDEPPMLSPDEPLISPATIISQSMVITGEVTSTGNIEVLGMIKGPISTTGNMKIEGKILGDLEGRNIALNGCMIQGNITAEGDISIDTAAIIVGDIKAANLKINGKVKGNLSIGDRLDINESAIVDGDASSRYISMSQGARLNGKVSVAADDQKDDDIFDIKFDL